MNKIYQSIRFHATVDEQLKKRHEALRYNNIVTLIGSRTKLIPFEVQTTLQIIPVNYRVDVYVVNSLGVETDVTATLTIYFGRRNITATSCQLYAVYDGNSTITALAQGIYYLHVKISGDGFSDAHRYSSQFKVGFFDTVTFEYKNSDTFGHLWMKGFYWSASYEGIVYDTGEFQDYRESNKNNDNYDVYTYKRKDKILATALIADSNALDTLEKAEMCDSVYFTNELGVRSPIEILEIVANPQGLSWYHNLTVKYRLTDDSIISVVKQNIIHVATQIGSVIAEVESGALTHDGKPITFGDDTITFNQQ